MGAKIKASFAQVFTDAAGRPEVKVVLGVPILLAAAIYLLAGGDLARFGALSGVGLSLLGVTAAADASYDKAWIASHPEYK